jgi:hypothetical protein
MAELGQMRAYRLPLFASVTVNAVRRRVVQRFRGGGPA